MKDMDIFEACTDTANMILSLYITNVDFKRMVNQARETGELSDMNPVQQVINGFALYNMNISKKTFESKGENENE